MKSEIFDAKTYNDFLKIEEVNKFLNFALTINLWREINNSFWDKRTINIEAIRLHDKDLARTLDQIVLRVRDFIQTSYHLEQPIYADTMDLVRWFPGMTQSPHCDDMSDNEEAHKNFGHRYFGCVIYLNDDYEGGETYYPRHNISVKPQAGKLAVHRADFNHLHGVTEVKGKIRYTLASFWTHEKSKALRSIQW